MKNTLFISALLILLLMLSAGCKENPNPQPKEEEGLSAPTDFKGPVKAITVTEYYEEGEPLTTRYEYDEKGKLLSETLISEYDDEEDLNENLSIKDENGRYTKQVWGPDDHVYAYQIYEYDPSGNITYVAYYQGDGTMNSITWNTYDEAGHQLSSSTQTPNGTYANSSEYDEKGNMVRSTSVFDGKTTNVTTYERDAAGREIMMHMQNLAGEYENWQYSSYDKDGNLIGWSSYNKEGEGEIQLQRQDTTFYDPDGLRHERAFENYGTPESYESTYNPQGHIIRYEKYEGFSTHPSYVVDYTYYPDGITLRERTCRKLVLGQEKWSKTKSFSEEVDTFGNWIARTIGPSHNFSLLAGETGELEESFVVIRRKFEYRGDDQGLNYGFTGRAGSADLRLAYSFDGHILCGEVTVDGNTWRAVGYRDREDHSLYIVALPQDGNIPWSLFIPAGDGTREGTLFKDGDEAIVATFTPTREGLKTYSFATTPDEIAGRYEFAFGGDFPCGTLDVSRCGENWEDVRFDVYRSGARGTLNFANDEFQAEGNRTEYYRYIWDDNDDTARSYEIYFFDGFAVILTNEWDSSPRPTVQGIYAKLPAVG